MKAPLRGPLKAALIRAYSAGLTYSSVVKELNKKGIEFPVVEARDFWAELRKGEIPSEESVVIEVEEFKQKMEELECLFQVN